MLCTLKEVLDDARAKKYGVGMFNAFNVELALGVFEAAEELQSPIIIGTAQALLPCASLELVASFLLPMIKKSKLPVALHLDHAFDESVIKEAIGVGFTSVMYDCSMKSFKENVERCASLTEYAHERNVSVEGELGHVALDEGGTGEGRGYVYTEPREVQDFVKLTGVDALAIAIGTEHGVYASKPVLDIERLKEIRALTDANLVLHGGSGLSLSDIQNCIESGIQKINIYTDISIAACGAAVKEIEDNGPAMNEVSVVMKEAVKKTARRKMIDFGSAGQA